ncbi:MAG: hypothetical protein ACM3SW_10120 [Actinomycetota bacterium]
MASDKENRVLGRRGARDITIPELEYINGAGTLHTEVCTAIMATGTVTGPGDGDGCSDSDSDSHIG